MAARCEAGRLAAGVWCRYRHGMFPGGAYRQVESIQRLVSGAPAVRLSFTNGEQVVTPADAVWEIDMEIDQ